MTLVFNGHDMSGTTAQRPTNADYGQPYFDTDYGKLMIWNGSAWQGAAVGEGVCEVSFVYNAPADGAFFVANRKWKVLGITVRPTVAGTDASAVTAQIRKAPSGTASASGTVLHTGTVNLKGTINTNQALTLSSTASDLQIASGDAICLDVTGTTTAAVGVVTVLLAPQV